MTDLPSGEAADRVQRRLQRGLDVDRVVGRHRNDLEQTHPRVGVGQGRLRLLGLGDVLSGAEHPDRGTIGRPDHLAVGERPPRRAVRADHAKLRGVWLAARARSTSDWTRCTIVGMNMRHEPLERRLELLGTETEDAIQLVRPLDRISPDVPPPAADVRQALRFAQPTLSIAHRFLGAPARGDVDHMHQQPS